MASAEREPITGFWGYRAYNRVLRVEPPAEFRSIAPGQGVRRAKPPP